LEQSSKKRVKKLKHLVEAVRISHQQAIYKVEVSFDIKGDKIKNRNGSILSLQIWISL
jgi:hypothetical protein